MATEVLQRRIVNNPHVPDEEAAAFLATNEWRYFETHWRPILPSRVWAVLSALYDHTRLNKETWAKREACWPSHEEIAARTHMDARTVRRILHRDADGKFTYAYRRRVYWLAIDADVDRYIGRKTLERQRDLERQKLRRQGEVATETHISATNPQKPIRCPFLPGQLIAGSPEEIPPGYDGPTFSLGDLIGMFVSKVQERYHYNAGAGQWQRASNVYTVSAIIPPVPDLRGKHAIMVNLADVRARRQEMQEGAVERETSFDGRARTNWPIHSADILPQEATDLKLQTRENDPSISRRRVASVAIGNASRQAPGRVPSPPPHNQPNRNERRQNRDQSFSIDQERKSAAQRPLGNVPGRVAVPDVERVEADDKDSYKTGPFDRNMPPIDVFVAEHPPELPAAAFLRESEIHRLQIDAVIGQAIEEIAAQQMEDRNPRATRALVVRALADAHVPLEQLAPALYLGRNRVARFQLAGGHIDKTLAGYFLNTMRNVAREGRSFAYDFAKQDTAEHVRQTAKLTESYGYIQTPMYRNSPQRPIQPTRPSSVRNSFDLAYQNQTRRRRDR
jgi:hypothetical protein